MIKFSTALLIIVSAACASQISKDDRELACVQQLELPSFPAIADSARVEAGVSAAVRLANDGSVENVSMQTTSGMDYAGKLFFPSVEKAMKASKFMASCAGSTVHIAFDFPFPTRSETGETVQTVRFMHPNRFEVALTPAPQRWYTVQQ
jgi:hypothetical protein